MSERIFIIYKECHPDSEGPKEIVKDKALKNTVTYPGVVIHVSCTDPEDFETEVLAVQGYRFAYSNNEAC